MSQDQINESNNRLIQTLQSRIRVVEEELRIMTLERNEWKGRSEALNILLLKEIEDLENKMKTNKNQSI